MKRIRELNRYQKVLLILLAGMLVIFAVLYAVISSRVGFEYAGTILVPREENGGTIYEGVIRGNDAVITVTPDQAVTLRYGDRIYGPYTAREDPTAVPEEDDYSKFMTGVEILDDGQIFFRGGVLSSGETLLLFDEEGSHFGVTTTVIMSDGTELDINGNVVDKMKPTPGMILELLDGPELTRKGEWMAWLMGAAVSVIAAVSILFADELFRYSISFRVRDPEYAEPSELEIAGRYFGWTALSLMALAVYIVGLL